jgi:hypothetical protein
MRRLFRVEKAGPRGRLFCCAVAKTDSRIVARVKRHDLWAVLLQPAQHLVELIEVAVTNAEHTTALAIVDADR